jgi:hypothetical protein
MHFSAPPDTPKSCLGVKWSQVQILSARPLSARPREAGLELRRCAAWLRAAVTWTPKPPSWNGTSTRSPPPPHPQLRAVYGVGPDTAATLLSGIGDNPGRINSDAAFAKLCGLCPLEASSGKTIRHRLNRGGNRDANRALHVILVVRMRRHQPTRAYIARRLAEGKTKNEIMRCLKRYIAREILHALHPRADKPPKSLLEHRL